MDALAIFTSPTMARKYARRRFRKKKKSRKSRSKLADKRINTTGYLPRLFEKRALEIAQAEDRKNVVYYQPMALHADENFNWTGLGEILHIPTAEFLSLNAGTLSPTLAISNFGNWIDNGLNSADGTALRANYVRCKYMKNEFTFKAVDQVGLTSASSTLGGVNVYAWIVSVDGAEQIDSVSTPVPSLSMFPFSGNGLYSLVPRAKRETIPYKYSIHAKKHIYIPTPKLFQPGAKKTGDDNVSVWVMPRRKMTLNLYFKGRGKRFQVRDGTRIPRVRQYYFCFTADKPVEYIGQTGQKICLEKLTALAQLASQSE